MLTAWEEQCQYVPNGTGTLSKMPNRYPANYPKFLIQGHGALVGDINHKTYVDLIAGLGAIGVGYSNELINSAIINQLNRGAVFSLPNRSEYQVSKLLTELVPNTDMWKFGLSGTDGNVMAVRATRAYTGRTKILTFGYNGCADQFEIKETRNAGIPTVLNDTISRGLYNNPDTLECLWSKEYACVLMEPMVYDYSKDGFLEEVRDICTKTDTLLVFDEVVNGGRFEKFVSSRYFGITPDLYVLGKSIANGLPLCAVGGSKHFMQTFERRDFFASGTFSTPCVSLAAAYQTLSILYGTLDYRITCGEKIKTMFNGLDWPEKCKAVGYPTRLDFRFPTKAHKFLFWQEMCNNGVLVGYANFVMSDMTEKELDTVLSAIQKSFETLKSAWKSPEAKLVGPIPEEALLRN